MCLGAWCACRLTATSGLPLHQAYRYIRLTTTSVHRTFSPLPSFESASPIAFLEETLPSADSDYGLSQPRLDL